MTRWKIVAALVAGSCLPSPLASARQALMASAGQARNTLPPATLFEGARIIAGDGRTIENGALLVEGDTITRVGKKGDVAAPKGATRVDLTGKTIMPGLVLAHGHIGYLRGTTFARENYTQANLIDHLNRYLYYGVVAMMSTGTDPGDLPFELRVAPHPGALCGARGIDRQSGDARRPVRRDDRRRSATRCP